MLRNIGCTALVALATTLLLVGCPDDAGTNNNDGGGGTPTEDTKVQSALSVAIDAHSVTLNWDLPTDNAGYLGTTISEASNAGSLSDPVEVAADTTTYTVTDLEAATEYTFTIATRYTNSGKNNSTTIAVTTGAFPSADTQVQNAASSAVTITSLTLNWDLPEDSDGYEGVTIRVESPADSTVPAVELDESITEYEFTNLGSAVDYIFTIATRYTDNGKNNSTTVAVTTLGVPTDDTIVQNITRAAFSTTTITLNWELPNDLRGYLGATISEGSDAGSLSMAQEIDENTTEYEVTTLTAATSYEFTIATRYADGGKNNSATATYMTAGPTDVQSVTFDSAETTSDSVTLTWDNPDDTAGYTGVIITVDNAIGDLSTPYSADQDTTTVFISGLDAATTYTPTFTFSTEYSGGKSGSSTMHPLTVTTQSTLVTGVIASDITSDTVTISWTAPEDTTDYSGVMISADSAVGDLTTIPQSVSQGTNTFVISDLTANNFYTLNLTFATQYTGSKSGGSGVYMVSFTTQSNMVTGTVASPASATGGAAITLSWSIPEDTTNYTGVAITAEPTIDTVTVGESATSATITGLAVATPYIFTLTTQYSGGKSGGDATIMARTPNLNLFDADADTLIDISSLDQLHNIRYNLDGTSYKTSDMDAGTMCGADATTTCTGYELTRNLDFTDGASYNNGMVNNTWRPNAMADSSGAVLAQSNAENATNAGWPLIGSCNADSGNEEILNPCGGNNTPFNTTFEGNSFVISNLYARNANTSTADGIGLFAIIGTSSTIRNLGVANGALYGSSNGRDVVGGLVGYNSGTITNSYATTTTVDGGAGRNDSVGGLVGNNRGTIITSYATDITANGGAGISDTVAALVGFQGSGTIIASYTSGTANGGADDGSRVGGLVGTSAGVIIASYSTATADGSAGDKDRVGGLMGSGFGDSTIIASYATGTATGGADDEDRVGGLAGVFEGDVIASYAIGNADGGSGSSDSANSLRGSGATPLSSSYGFGIILNNEVIGGGFSGSADRPSAASVATGTGRTGAALLLAPDPSDSTNTAVPATWNDADHNTLDAWDFGGTSDLPALHYADYDGDGTEYGCGGTSGTIATIPNTVPDGAGGTMTVNCGVTLLPGQGR